MLYQIEAVIKDAYGPTHKLESILSESDMLWEKAIQIGDEAAQYYKVGYVLCLCESVYA
jgi:hypothetical protein